MVDLNDDPQLRAALQTARSWGVSPSAFGGAPRTSQTHYVYDDTGRLIRSWTVADPEWSDDDRALAFALADWEADQCPGCGGNLAETTKREHEYAYVPDSAREALCHRCVGHTIAGSRYAEHPHARAMMIPLRLDDARVAVNRARIDQEEAAARGDHRSAGT